MKKILLTIVLLILPTLVFAKNDLVNVYVFETKEECAYCKEQIKYLKSLDSYNQKFNIIIKYTFDDDKEWRLSDDFSLGVKVANAFKDNGFDNTNYLAVPFVVISDIYAATYSKDLEKVIDEAYDKGDKDIVSCIQENKDNCLGNYNAQEAENKANEEINKRIKNQIEVCLRSKEGNCDKLYEGTKYQEIFGGLYDEVYEELKDELDTTKIDVSPSVIIIIIVGALVITAITIGAYKIITKEDN